VLLPTRDQVGHGGVQGTGEPLHLLDVNDRLRPGIHPCAVGGVEPDVDQEQQGKRPFGFRINAPRQRPEIPGADLIPDIVPEGDEFLDADEEPEPGFWEDVGIDPISIPSDEGEVATLRCFLDHQPVFLGRDCRIGPYADIRKGEEAEEIFRFITFWQRAHKTLPRHLVFDSRLTTHANLARLDTMGIAFITLRRRSAALLKEIVELPRSAWRTIELEVPTRKFRTPRVYEQKVRLAGRVFRQVYILDLGHEQPTILLTNQTRTPIKHLITRYAHRMLIENALSDAVRFFHMDALSSAVGFKVDFDLLLLVIASGLYRLLARRMRGYRDAQARHIFRDLVDMPATVTITAREVTVSFHRRAHLPILLASGLFDKPVRVPWWGNRTLRLTTYTV